MLCKIHLDPPSRHASPSPPDVTTVRPRRQPHQQTHSRSDIAHPLDESAKGPVCAILRVSLAVARCAAAVDSRRARCHLSDLVRLVLAVVKQRPVLMLIF